MKLFLNPFAIFRVNIYFLAFFFLALFKFFMQLNSQTKSNTRSRMIQSFKTYLFKSVFKSAKYHNVSSSCQIHFHPSPPSTVCVRPTASWAPERTSLLKETWATVTSSGRSEITSVLSPSSPAWWVLRRWIFAILKVDHFVLDSPTIVLHSSNALIGQNPNAHYHIGFTVTVLPSLWQRLQIN